MLYALGLAAVVAVAVAATVWLLWRRAGRQPGGRLVERPARQRGVGRPHPDARGCQGAEEVRLPVQGRGEGGGRSRRRAAGIGHRRADRARIGGGIRAAEQGAPLPSVEDVINLTAGRSAHERLAQIGEHWLLPVLAGVPLERLNGAHAAAVFTRIEQINAEITARQDGGRAYVRVDGDVRERPRVVGTASQHRIYAALREFANFEVRRTRRLAFNPHAVELQPEITPEAQRWSAEQARVFLAATADDPLGLLEAAPCPVVRHRPGRRGAHRAARRCAAISRRFKALARDAGLPPIKLHEGRHSAASLARDAQADPEIRRKTLGHADQAMTSHYTHIEAQAHRAAAEMVAQYVKEAGS